MSATETRGSYAGFREIAPAAHAALMAAGKAVEESGLDQSLVELVKLRVSQLNRCAFCLQHHLTIARQLGIAAAKIDLIAAWADAGVFSAREKAALAWAEALTLQATQEIPEAAWEALRAQFSESEVVFLTMAIGTINNWNRLGAGLRFAPTIPKTAL